MNPFPQRFAGLIEAGSLPPATPDPQRFPRRFAVASPTSMGAAGASGACPGAQTRAIPPSERRHRLCSARRLAGQPGEDLIKRGEIRLQRPARAHRTVYRAGPRQLRFEERDSIEQLAINGDGKMPSNFELGFAPDQGRV